MKTINKGDLNVHVIRYTVELRHGQIGTATYIEQDYYISEGTSDVAVQFIDEYGNHMARSGVVKRVLKTEYFNFGFEECRIV